MQNKTGTMEFSCNDVLVIHHIFGKKIGYTYTFNPTTKVNEINHKNISAMRYIQRTKIDVLVLTKKLGNIDQYTSILDGHKEYSPFVNRAKKNMEFLNTCRLATSLTQDGCLGTKEDFLGTIKDEFNNTCYVYKSKNSFNINELLKHDEEKVIDKLLTSQHITANDISESKKIINKVNAELERRYNLFLDITSKIELFENFTQKEKDRIAKLERKRQIKAEQLKLRERKKCIEKIAEKQ